MTTGSILLGIALLLVVGLWLARPFLLGTAHEAAVRRLNKRHELELQKQAILDEVRDLEFDHDTGKIPTEVFEPQREFLMTQAAAVLKEIDALKAKRAQRKPAVDDDIEAAVAQLRGRQPAKPKPAAARQPRPKTAVNGVAKGGYCPQCGQPFDVDDKFCAACGHALHARQPA